MTTLTYLLLAPLAVQLQRVVTPFGRSAARSFGTLKQLDANFPRTDACRRSDGQTLEGVHADPGDPLMERVLHRVPELARWEDWYRSPLFMRNGHVHTIFAAKTRRTRAVRYHRLLVPTPDGGTLAIDLLAGIRRKMQRDGSIFSGSGGLLPGAAEDTEGGDTHFVDVPPDLNASRPMLLLASGLGGGSQDTYVRSMAATAAERGWQVAVVNMRGCGGSPVTSPRLFSAFRGANDDLRLAVSHLRRTRLAGVGDARLAVIGWSNSGTILNNVLAEQATTHANEHDGTARIDAGVACACPFNMPANSANLRRRFHSAVYDRNLGKSLQRLWAAARPQFVDAVTDTPVPVPYWSGLGRSGLLDPTGAEKAGGSFVADDQLARTALSIRELDEALTRRQYGYESVDDYYYAASSDQRLGLIETPLLLLNAYDDPIVPGVSLRRALDNARANPNLLMAITADGGHLGWCEPSNPTGGPAWIERVSSGFLEAVLGIEPTDACENLGCEIFD